MGHQLLLCATVPHSKYVQTMATLSALTGVLHPQDIATYTLVTKPHNVFKPKFEPGKVNQIEQFYMRCTTTWTDVAWDLAEPFTEESELHVDRLFQGKEVKYWTLHILDLPNAAKNPVLAYNYHESTIVHHHAAPAAVKTEDSDAMETDPKDSFLQFLEDLGYDVTNQYWLKGIRFFHGDIVIELFKLFVRNDSEAAADGKLKLKVLDASNAFQVKAYMDFPKGARVDSISNGTKELTTLKETLNNLFELEVPDRMFMDTRVTRSA